MSVLFRSQIEILSEAKQGTVVKAIAPNQRGRVKAMGSFWPAEFYHPDSKATLLPGQLVLAIAIKGITLLVVPVS